MHKLQAFTLVELLMSMAMMSMIGLSIAGLSVAMGNSYDASEGYYDALQNGRNTMLRIEATARKAKLITASTSNSVTFWAGDANGDGQINLDEIRTLQFSGGTIVETRVDFGNAWNKAALNVTVALNNIKTVSSALSVQNSSTYRVTSTLASDVTEFQVQVSPSAPLATRLDIRFTLGSGEQKLTLANTACLRANATAKVGQVGSTWVLSQQEIP